jgi:replication-associated recombination protein RarA
MRRRAWKGALLVCGEPGTGKSRWIRQEATTTGSRLFRWNARIDRSLREGREILHQQVRSCEPLFVWIEGADDLTQEAQAFLRRILETASQNVVCALEVRELWKMSSPILSRCTVVTMKLDYSFRSNANTQKAIQFGLLPPSKNNYEVIQFKDLPVLRNSGGDPYAIFDSFLSSRQNTEEISNELIQCISSIGRGSSPWIQLANYLMRQEMKREGNNS